MDDWGRSTGFAFTPEPSGDTPAAYLSNMGPLVNGNQLANNSINGMLVRGGVITTQVVFDDTDIVHVVEDEITSPDVSTVGGLRIQSSATQSLVVKLLGATAGFTATGEPGDISGRIGGFVDIVGTPNHPVVLTSLNDNTVGAGYTPSGQPDDDTGNNPTAVAAPGDWRSVKLDAYSNDNNFLVVNGYQQNTSSNPAEPDANQRPVPRPTGAPTWNRATTTTVSASRFTARSISPATSTSTASTRPPARKSGSRWTTPVPRSAASLNWSTRRAPWSLRPTPSSIPRPKPTPCNTPGWPRPCNSARSIRPIGTRSTCATPVCRSCCPAAVRPRASIPTTCASRSEPANLSNLANINDGTTTGDYQLQIRLSDEYQFPGSEVQYATIDYATNGVQVLGQPEASPLIGDTVSTGGNNSFATAQDLGNLLDTSQTQISVAGNLSSQDWYKFELNYNLVQSIAGNNASLTWPAVFQVSYADGLVRPQTTLALYDSNGDLLMVGRDADVADAEPPVPSEGPDESDLTHGSFGSDPFIGTVQLNTANTYYLCVMPSTMLPAPLDQTFQANATDPLTRIEPIDTVERVAETQVGMDTDQGDTADPPPSLSLTPTPYNFGNVVMYVNTPSNLYTVDPLTGTTETTVGALNGTIDDIAMRNDGQLYAFTTGNTDASDNFTEISTANASTLSSTYDGIVTYQLNMATPPAPVVQNVGLNINALAYEQTEGSDANRTLWGVGNRVNGLGVNQTTNLLYEFDPNAGTVDGNAANPTLPTNISPVGEVLSGPVITVPLVTAPPNNATSNAIPIIQDGQTIKIGTTTFEFDTGPDLNLDTNGGENTRDGQQFSINGTTFEFDSGPVLVVNGAGSTFEPSGTTLDAFTLTSSSGAQYTYDFVDTTSSTQTNATGDTAIDYQPTFSQAQMVAAIVSAINGSPAGITATAVGDRITMTGDSTTAGYQPPATTPMAAMVVQGAAGVSPGALPCRSRKLTRKRRWGRRCRRPSMRPISASPPVSAAAA